ncbi:DUF6473 family protein [Algirhabdus cladophorae]|uniref:DUF6473 family protein n=1 Tax=Algirhabdus cladophorae TaxID=3377108 RepID=UPI003B84A6DA
MSYENMAFSALDYKPCHYGTSKLMFRGPARSVDGDFIAFVGGTETYGKYVAEPFCDQLEPLLGHPCVNLGVLQAGPDAFLKDSGAMAICGQAILTVVQLPNAVNLSNRFYMVHPRRNDRFLRASTILQSIYHDVDFTDFAFVRHMLETLKETSAERFEMVVEEMQKAWLHRTRQLLEAIQGPKIVFGLRGHHLESDGGTNALGAEPVYVSEEMSFAIAPFADSLTWITPSAKAIGQGPDELQIPEGEQEAARFVMGPAAHREVARQLSDLIKVALDSAK